MTQLTVWMAERNCQQQNQDVITQLCCGAVAKMHINISSQAITCHLLYSSHATIHPYAYLPSLGAKMAQLTAQACMFPDMLRKALCHLPIQSSGRGPRLGSERCHIGRCCS
jgi:hypothetical protein